ncbi:type I DNA topoisomerase [Candidatus Mycoplasma haematominutum]|nr:type I DNA topoisomerase [Candidatus Mycoplasma haematominutum]
MFVESPTKVKSIGKYLNDKDMKILATKGHIRDLAKGWIGFGPGKLDIKWEDKNSSIIREIKKAADKANKIYLSTDPDREGEAISWHIFEVIGKDNQKKCLRAVFNEISEKAVKKAIDNPRELDQAQVDSYLARRLLDRWIGFKLSQYTGKKMGGESAGRVQSIALKFLADREEEIKSFKKEEWFILDVLLENDLKISLFQLSGELKDQIRIIETEDKSRIRFETSVDAENLIHKLDTSYRLEEISEPKLFFDNPPLPLKTSTLYEKSINIFGMKSDMVREVSQKLYEGINLGGEIVALITYPRTDKTELSSDFVQELKKYILSRYSTSYWQGDNLKLSESSMKKHAPLVQGAHEGIRPIDLSWTPSRVSKFITTNSPEYKVYSLIWAYTLAAFSKSTKIRTTRYFFNNQENLFVVSDIVEIFDGFKKFLREQGLLTFPESPNTVFKELRKGETYEQKSFSIESRQNKPPRKYSEASLIKALEKKGIGRPSTYPTISKTVLKRNYATIKNKYFEITELGIKISKDLDKNFSNFISYDYTRIMEEELDNISQSKTDWRKFLENLFVEWGDAFNKAEKIEIVEGRVCPECGAELAKKFAKKWKNYTSSSLGQFIGCTKYPQCKYLERSEISKKEAEFVDKNCPECSSQLVRRKNRWNRYFTACSAYPKCKYLEKEVVQFELVENEFCQGCSAQLIYRESAKRPGKKFKACPNFPSCRYISTGKSSQLLDTKCKLCDNFLKKIVSRWGNQFIACSSYPKCKYRENIVQDKKS